MRAKTSILIAAAILLGSIVPGTVSGNGNSGHWRIYGLYGQHHVYDGQQIIETYKTTTIFGNPNFSQKPDFKRISDDVMHLAWIDTYDKGVFLPAYARFDGVSWKGYKSMYGPPIRRTHGLDDVVDRDSGFLTSCSKVMLALKKNYSMYGNFYDDYPYLVASWSTPSGSSLYYVKRVQSAVDSPEWEPVINGDTEYKFNHKDFDIAYDDEYIYMVWLKLINGYWQVVTSRMSYITETWEHLDGDVAPYGSINPAQAQMTVVTKDETQKYTPTIEVYNSIPIVCWENSESEIMMARWNRDDGIWEDLLGNPNQSTNVSNTPDGESHYPDFKIDNYGNPIIVWNESIPLSNRVGVACSRWIGSWRGYKNSIDPFSFVAETQTVGETENPKIDLMGYEQFPVITWNQMYSDVNGSGISSALTYWDGSHFVGFNELTGYSYLHANEYGKAVDVTPYVIGEDDFELIGVGSMHFMDFWSAEQTDIVYARARKGPLDSNPLILNHKIPFYNTRYQGWTSIQLFTSYEYSLVFQREPGKRFLYMFFNNAFVTVSVADPQMNPLARYKIYYKSLLAPPPYYGWGVISPTYYSSHMYTNILMIDLEDLPIVDSETGEPIEYTLYIRYNTNPFPPNINPPYYYCSTFFSDSAFLESPFGSNDIENRNFIGNNIPYEGNFLHVQPDYQYLDECGDWKVFTVRLKNPWLYDQFEYELNIANPYDLGDLEYFFNPQQGISERNKNIVYSNLYIKAPCGTPAVWFKPMINATVSKRNGGTNDYFVASKEVKVLVRKPEIFAKKTAKSSMAAVGDVVKYIITVGNKGNGTATDIKVFDYLPNDLEYVMSNPVGSVKANTVEWRFDEIPPGEKYDIVVYCRIKANTHLKAGDIITNSAEVTGLKDRLNAQMAITIKSSRPGCETPQVELFIEDIGKNNIVKVDEKLNCELRIHSGCSPFNSTIYWGDETESDTFVIGESMLHKLTHTYTEPGDYLIRTNVTDEFGKAVTLYKHIHVLVE